MGKVISERWGLPGRPRALALLLLVFVAVIRWESDVVVAQECGIRRLSAVGLINAGVKAKPGDWPWHVALFVKENGEELKYTCGGSIISQNFVLTAAHCIQNPNPEQHVIKAGLYDLTNEAASNASAYNVFEIIVHPKYLEINFYNDIALMRPDRTISFRPDIFPICLWPADNPTLLDVMKSTGIVVGFGINKANQLQTSLQQANMVVVEKQQCIQKVPEGSKDMVRDAGKMCAEGTRSGTNVCSGDSGGGLYFEKDDVFYLRGLVSAAPRTKGNEVCQTDHPVGYTDVKQYLDWIQAHQRIVDERNLLRLEDCGLVRNPTIENELDRPLFNQYPWNVLLEFRLVAKSQINLVCGGVLVHPRFVLTVGHCVDGIIESYKLSSVRLGEFNVRTTLDTDPTNKDNSVTTFQTVDIERVILHPNFNKPMYSNNFALLKLKHNVDTSKPNVKPICLPSQEDFKDSSLTVTGWKRNKYAFPTLAREAMNITSTDLCRNEYRKINVKLPDTEDVMCAVPANQRNDQCHSFTAGSPLQYIKRVDRVPRYFLAGLLVFNFPRCQENGNEALVNLNLAVDWIKDTVK